MRPLYTKLQALSSSQEHWQDRKYNQNSINNSNLKQKCWYARQTERQTKRQTERQTDGINQFIFNLLTNDFNLIFFQAFIIFWVSTFHKKLFSTSLAFQLSKVVENYFRVFWAAWLYIHLKLLQLYKIFQNYRAMDLLGFPAYNCV